MAAAGGLIHRNISVADQPDVVMQQLVVATAGAPGYTINTAGSSALILTRKYWPNWLITLAIIGALFALIGLLALLYRKEETLTVTVAPGGSEGAQLRISESRQPR